MAVTKQIVNGKPVWIRSGSPEFYCSVYFGQDGVKRIDEIGYTGGGKYKSMPIMTKESIQSSNPEAFAFLDFNADGTPADRTELEKFLLALYASGTILAGDTQNVNDLNADMVKYGITDQYASINIADFMVFTGAIDRLYQKADGSYVDITTLGPNDQRPFIREVPKRSYDLMLKIITHTGMSGIVKYLYASEGITFEQLVDCTLHFYPDKQERRNHFNYELLPFLISKFVPSLTEEQIAKFDLI